MNSNRAFRNLLTAGAIVALTLGVLFIPRQEAAAASTGAPVAPRIEHASTSVQQAITLVWKMVKAGNTACKYLDCKGWSKSLASKFIGVLAAASTLSHLASAVLQAKKVNDDLGALSKALHSSRRSSPRVRRAAQKLCTDSQTLQRSLIDSLPWPASAAAYQLFPVPSC